MSESTRWILQLPRCFSEICELGFPISCSQVFIYMDDLVIPARNEEEASQLLERVLDSAQEYGLEIKCSKCQFLKTMIEFLGQVVEDGKVLTSTKKNSAVQNYPEPRILADVHSY